MDEKKELLENLIKNNAIINNIDREKKSIELIGAIDYNKELIMVSKLEIDNLENYSHIIDSPEFKNSIFKKQNRGILLVDIVGYSKGNTEYQAAILNLFNQGFSRALNVILMPKNYPLVDQIIPTGDGCYIIFNEIVNDRFIRVALFIMSSIRALENDWMLQNKLDPKNQNHLSLRIGATFGELSYFTDISGKRNCFGEGMNEAARILVYGQKDFEDKFPKLNSNDSIFFDESVLNQVNLLFPELKKLNKDCALYDLGLVNDKHNKQRNIYALVNLPERMAFTIFTIQEKLKYDG